MENIFIIYSVISTILFIIGIILLFSMRIFYLWLILLLAIVCVFWLPILLSLIVAEGASKKLDNLLKKAKISPISWEIFQ